MKPISKNQYDLYVFFTRHNLAEYFNEELEWYINELGNAWGVICRDRTDQDYTAIISMRDENKQIRCVDIKISFETIKSARGWLFDRVKELEKESNINEPVKQQKKKRNKNIFDPVAKPEKINEYFKFLASSPADSAARNVIKEIMPHFFDVDNNFIQQFQTEGFDARLWELYLFCYFNEEGLAINRTYNAPDFLLSDGTLSVGVEAVVVANKGLKMKWGGFPSKDDILKDKEIMPMKWGSPLDRKLTHTDKLGRHYWEHAHTINQPFVIAIADFHETFSMTWSQNSLITYLYGYEYNYTYSDTGELIIESRKVKEHISGEKKIPSGFFFQKDAENISAVLHSSCATISKFNRIGKQCGFDENDIIMYRICSVYDPTPNASKPLIFPYIVTEENSEPWGEGVTIFHNPNAKHPLPKDFFQDVTQCYLENEYIATYSHGCTVFSSVTMTFTSQEKMKDYIKDMG